MTIPDASKPSPLGPLDANNPIVDIRTGLPTTQFIASYEAMRRYIESGNRVTPCSASTVSNKITLTPNDASPLLVGYIDYEVFSFAADVTSDGLLTATVVPVTGTLATLKVFKTDGAAQATTGDIVANSVYQFLFADHLDSSAGGFVLK